MKNYVNQGNSKESLRIFVDFQNSGKKWQNEKRNNCFIPNMMLICRFLFHKNRKIISDSISHLVRCCRIFVFYRHISTRESSIRRALRLNAIISNIHDIACNCSRLKCGKRRKNIHRLAICSHWFLFSGEWFELSSFTKNHVANCKSVSFTMNFSIWNVTVFDFTT